MKRLLIILCLIGAVTAAAVFFVVLPMTSQAEMKSVLREVGFTHARIGKTTKIPGGYNFESVNLDSDEFSTIENLTLQDSKDGKRLAVDKLVLTASWEQGKAPDISGWTLPARIENIANDMRQNKISTVSMTGGQLDIVVPYAGLIRVEAKGQLDLLPDGAVRLQGVIWSVQKRLKAELHVNGEFAPNGIASIDFEITDGKVNIMPLSVSRVGGWLIMNKNTATDPWGISAQLVAGAARIHGLPLNDLTLTAQGNLQDAGISIQGGGKENSRAALAVDAHFRKNGKDSVSATLRADNFAELIGAMAATPDEGDATLPAPSQTTRPGAIAIYDTESDTLGTLFDTVNVGLSDLSGKVWMRGTLKQNKELTIQQVAVKELAEAFGVKDIDSNGTLTGIIPFSRDEKLGFKIDQGLLRATAPATIRYNGETLPPALQSTRKDAAKILQSFNFDNCELLMSGPLSGALEGDISMTGKVDGEDSKATLVTLHFNGPLLKK